MPGTVFGWARRLLPMLVCAFAPGLALAQGPYGAPPMYAPPQGMLGPRPVMYGPQPAYPPTAPPSVTPIDAQAIMQRLEQQSAEIEQLRAQVLANKAELQSQASPLFSANQAEDVGATDGVRQASLEQQAAKAVAEKKKDDGWKDMSAEKWTVKLGGHVQLDYVTWPQASAAIVGDDNYFNYRRLRLVADGTGYGQFDFRLQMTLEPGQGSNDSPLASPDVKDAYFTMHDIPWLGRGRIGNFFVPFSLEQVTNDTNNIFMERSIPTQGIFSAEREVGFAFYNCAADQNLTWTWGFFFDEISDTFKAKIDDNQGYRLSGRLTWLPYYDEPSDGRYLIHTGVGILHTDDYDNLVRFRARPQVQRGPFLIDSGNLAADTYTTGGLEFAVVWGQVTLQSEAFVSSVAMNAGGPATVGGAYAHLSYFVTGESRVFERFGQHGPQFGRNRPITNFFAVPGCFGSGALELKGRWSNLNLTDVNEGQYNDFTFGFNWYWSDRTRIMFDWIHPYTTSETPFGSVEADLVAMRFDFNW
jgi:phosphate-selective porin OprO/OprP